MMASIIDTLPIILGNSIKFIAGILLITMLAIPLTDIILGVIGK